MKQKIKILHLEDVESDAELIDHELRKAKIEFEKRVVDTREEYEQMLAAFDPDIILSDHSLPSFNSYKALEILKEKGLDIPFLLVTATVSEEFAVDIMKQGAADYILKDRTQRLPSAIINSIEKHILEKEKKVIEKQKDNFLSMASHELKTPLTTIKLYEQLAESMLSEKGNNNAATLNVVKRMGTQIDRLETLVKALLDFTRIQKGKLMYEKEFFDFSNLVKEVTEDVQKTNQTHAIESHIAIGINVFGDKNKLSQVIINLLSNAIKYSPNAKSIIVKSQLQVDGIELSVKDFGIGISPENLPNIFQQFYRVTSDIHSTFPGMGIGLYICAEIIANHAGKIWVESVKDQGSTFYVGLPFGHPIEIPKDSDEKLGMPI